MEQARHSMAAANKALADQNKQLHQRIEASINEKVAAGNPRVEFVRRPMSDLQSKTTDVIGTLDNLRGKLISAGGGEQQGNVANPEESSGNQALWRLSDDNSGRGNGEAKLLREKLNDYSEWASKTIAMMDTTGTKTKSIPPIAPDPSGDPTLPAYADKGQPWEAYNFEGTTVIADLVTMERLMQGVYGVQGQLLRYFAGIAGESQAMQTNAFRVISIPTSNVVTAGMKFETKLMVAQIDEDLHPEFIGQGIVVDRSGTSATMQMTAPGGFSMGQNEKLVDYKAIVRIPTPDRNVQEMRLDGQYTVRKPEVVITSASVQILYANCGNTINVDVPALGGFYAPKFTATEADVLPSSSDKRVVTIVPRGKSCVLGVSSNSNGQMIKVDDVKYRVIAPPRPEIVLEVLGKEYNGVTPIPAKADCKVKMRPDRYFQTGLPKDARYTVDHIDLLVARSLGAPAKVATYSGSGKDAGQGIPTPLGNSLKSEIPGTKCYFKIGTISRLNFQNKRIAEDFGDRELYIGFVIK